MSNHDAGLLQHHEPESWRFYVYGEDDDGDPLFSFWMNIGPNTGVCIYDRSGGAGKWLSTAHDDEEYGALPPTDGLEACIRETIASEEGIDGARVEALDDHEAYFYRAIYGTLEQKGHAPDELLRFIEHCLGGEVRLA